jgi:oligopeptidase B
MSNIPIADRKLEKVKFGLVDGEDRGVNLINPPKEIDDYYFWLRDETRKRKDVLKYLNDENEYTRLIMNNNEEIKNMFKEIKSHIKENYETYPYPYGKGGWDSKYRYFVRTVEGLSYPIYCRKNMITNNKEVLLDVNILAKDKSHCDVSSFSVTKDHKYITYGIDEEGNEKFKIIIERISDKKLMNHGIPDLMYCNYFWHKNNIYYEMGNESNRMFQIWRYNFISKETEKIYQNDEEVVSVGITMSKDKKYFFISASSYNSSEYYYFTEEDTKVKLFTKKEDGVLYSVDYHEGRFIILTNEDNCRNFKIMTTDIGKTDKQYWRDLMPYDKKKFIKGTYELKNHLLVLYKEEGNNYIKVINLVNRKYNIKESYNIKINEEIKNIELNFMDIYDTNIIWYTYDSLNTPISLYEFNLDSKNRKLLREKEVPNFSKNDYECKRIYAKSHDGVMVPMSMVYKKETFKKNGKNPLYLYGYGSYGHTVEPDFSPKILPLINRGFVYVIAHVRGGSFLGYKWYEDGKMKKKMNTFYDFIACAEHLIKEDYTFEKGITIEGRSAGGLLVGACMTMRPDLFRTVIAGVPFVDVLATMSDPSIPLTAPEWEQWGNPNQEEYYEYIRKYSPIDNIRKTSYPNALILAGLNDPRVQYWEPAKFVAKLRYYKTDDNILLLKTEMEEGHFGGSDRYKYMKELAFSYIFVLKTYNLLDNISHYPFLLNL